MKQIYDILYVVTEESYHCAPVPHEKTPRLCEALEASSKKIIYSHYITRYTAKYIRYIGSFQRKNSVGVTMWDFVEWVILWMWIQLWQMLYNKITSAEHEFASVPLKYFNVYESSQRIYFSRITTPCYLKTARKSEI